MKKPYWRTKGARSWSASEDYYLRVNYARMSVFDVAHYLGRSHDAVEARAERLGVIRSLPMRNWSAIEIDALWQEHEQKTVSELAVMLKMPKSRVWHALRALNISAKRSESFWTSSEIEVLRREYATKSVSQVGKQMGRTSSSIRNIVHKQVITKPRTYVPLNDLHMQILIGSLFGDGAIFNSNGTTPCFRETHTVRQNDYLIWKVNQLKPVLGGNVRYLSRRSPCTGKLYDYVEYHSHTHPELKILHKAFYPNGKGRKCVPINLLNVLKPLGLAVWFCDDGTRGSSSLSLCTDGFSETEVRLIANWFHETINISPRVVKNSKNHHHVLFRRVAAEQLRSIIAPYVHPSMTYKLRLTELRNGTIVPNVDNVFTKSCGSIPIPIVEGGNDLNERFS